MSIFAGHWFTFSFPLGARPSSPSSIARSTLATWEHWCSSFAIIPMTTLSQASQRAFRMVASVCTANIDRSWRNRVERPLSNLRFRPVRPPCSAFTASPQVQAVPPVHQQLLPRERGTGAMHVFLPSFLGLTTQWCADSGGSSWCSLVGCPLLGELSLGHARLHQICGTRVLASGRMNLPQYEVLC